MPRDYSWARRFVPRDCFTVGELADVLCIGSHQARRRLLQSGLPYRLITRRWQHPLDQCWYVRRTYAIPPETADALYWADAEDGWARMQRHLIRHGARLSPAQRRPLRDLFKHTRNRAS